MTTPGDQRPAPRTLPDLLALRAAKNPGGAFLIDDDGCLSWEQTWTAARRVAAGLESAGIRRGDRIAVMLENCREFVLAWFGAVTLGAVQVPINPQAIGSHLTYVLNHSGARALICAAGALDQVRAISAGLETVDQIYVVGSLPAGIGGAEQPFERLLGRTPLAYLPGAVGAGDTTAIMYTSGSTGRPKGVVMPHGQHVENGRQAVAAAEITASDRVYVCLPLHHNMAQGYGLMPALVSGASVCLGRRFQRATFWDDVRKHACTVWPFVGAMLVLLAKDMGNGEPNPLRVAYGVPIPVELHAGFEKQFDLRLIPCYGSTEATIVAWGSVPGGEPLGSCGRVLPTFDVEIQDADGWPLGPDTVGEICVRPRRPYTMFQGYHNEPERGRLAVRNLWFHTGDQGRLDPDHHLWFAGRTDDVVRRFGEFIAASQVEEAVLGHARVELVAAYGIRDEVAGEEVMVAVVPRAGATLTASDVLTWCRERLPAFAVPRFIEVVDGLPMTATGKVEKFVLRGRGLSASTLDVRRSEQENH